MLLSRRFAFWTAECLLFLLAGAVGCTRIPDAKPVADPDRVIATLFKVDGVVSDEHVRGLRAYLLVNRENQFVLSLMTAMNTQLAAIRYDGDSGLMVDYRNRTAYRDLHPPFDFQGVFRFRVDLAELVSFYREAYLSGKPFRRTHNWGITFLNDQGDLVAMLQDGSRLLMSPVKPPSQKSMALPALGIPEGYRVLDEISHPGVRQD